MISDCMKPAVQHFLMYSALCSSLLHPVFWSTPLTEISSCPSTRLVSHRQHINQIDLTIKRNIWPGVTLNLGRQQFERQKFFRVCERHLVVYSGSEDVMCRGPCTHDSSIRLLFPQIHVGHKLRVHGFLLFTITLTEVPQEVAVAARPANVLLETISGGDAGRGFSIVIYKPVLGWWWGFCWSEHSPGWEWSTRWCLRCICIAFCWCPPLSWVQICWLLRQLPASMRALLPQMQH